MNSLQTSLILLLMVSLSGCFYTQEAKPRIGRDAKGRSIAVECEQIHLRGNLSVVLNSIHQDADKVLQITGEADPRAQLQEVELLAERIHENLLTLQGLLQPLWVRDRWPYFVYWEIPFRDLGLRSGEDPDLTSVKVEKIFINGVERADLIKKIKINMTEQVLQVSLQKLASSIEVCELQNTVGIIVEVEQKGPGMLRHLRLLIKKEKT